MTSNRSPAARSAVPPCRAAERGTLEGNSGTEQRNNSGTTDLEALADKVLSRVRGGTTSGTPAEQTPVEPFRPPRNAPCSHVADPDLAEWYAENPKVTCARCWLERKGMLIQAEDPRTPKATSPADGALNHIAARPIGGASR